MVHSPDKLECKSHGFQLSPNKNRVYDIDKDGFISNGELFAVLKKMVGENLHDTQLQQIVDKTIMIHDKVSGGLRAHVTSGWN